MENTFNQSNYKTTDQYTITVKIINDLQETHTYDPDFLKGLNIMRDAIDDRVSALLLVAHFFKQGDLDLFGEKLQKDRIAFFKLCRQLEESDFCQILRQRIIHDMSYHQGSEESFDEYAETPKTHDTCKEGFDEYAETNRNTYRSGDFQRMYEEQRSQRQRRGRTQSRSR